MQLEALSRERIRLRGLLIGPLPESGDRGVRGRDRTSGLALRLAASTHWRAGPHDAAACVSSNHGSLALHMWRLAPLEGGSLQQPYGPFLARFQRNDLPTSISRFSPGA